MERPALPLPSIRSARGWVFQEGVDDIESECDLDDFTEWDIVLVNDGTVPGEELLKPIVERVEPTRRFDKTAGGLKVRFVPPKVIGGPTYNFRWAIGARPPAQGGGKHT